VKNFDLGSPTKLCGLYSADMNNDECNAWHEYLEDDADWLRKGVINIEIGILECQLSSGTDPYTPNIPGKIRELYKERLGIERRLYDKAKAWCKENVEPPYGIKRYVKLSELKEIFENMHEYINGMSLEMFKKIVELTIKVNS